jgi:PEP-CTERM motif
MAHRFTLAAVFFAGATVIPGIAAAQVNTSARSVNQYDSGGAVSTYRTGANSSGVYTQPGDANSQQFDVCATRQANGVACSATKGGTPVSAPPNLAAATSNVTYGDGHNGSSPFVTGSAAARADLTTGELGGVSISSARGCSIYFCGISSDSYARLDDLVTFNVAGANASTVTPITVTFSLDGLLDTSQNFYAAGIVSNYLYFGNALAYANFYQYHSDNNYGGGWASHNWTFDPVNPSSRATFTGVYNLVGSAPSVGLTATLYTSAFSGAVTDYMNTSRVRFNLPSNVSFSSQSGSFLTGLSAGGVPEPATWAMMILGFGVIGGAMRTRRRVAHAVV